MTNHSEHRINLIRKRLVQALNPTFLNIQDESRQHATHAEAQKQPGGHFRVEIIASLFIEKPAIERHRMIYAALGDTMGELIHAISIDAKTPSEAHAYRPEIENPDPALVSS